MRLGYAVREHAAAVLRADVAAGERDAERLRELIEANLAALEILRWNADNESRSSAPRRTQTAFGSHAANELAWWEEFGPRLGKLRPSHAGEACASRHPGQYTVLSSARPTVVSAAVAELEYRPAPDRSRAGRFAQDRAPCRLGSGVDDRFAAGFARLSSGAAARLVLENDERRPLADVLDLARRLRLPVVVDVFHHALAPSLEEAGHARPRPLRRGHLGREGRPTGGALLDAGARQAAGRPRGQDRPRRSSVVRHRGRRPAARLHPRGEGKGTVRSPCPDTPARR